MRGVIAALLLWTLAAAPQQTGQNTPPEGKGTAKIAVSTQLVVETVVVKDKKGNPIEGLTAKDFIVGAQSAAPVAPSKPEDIKIYHDLARTRISPETPGNIRYKDRRLLALYFDMSAMPPPDQLRALAAAQKFIRTEMKSADLVSILRYSGGAVDVLLDFTGERNRLLSVIATLIVGEGQGSDESTDDASTSDTGAAFGQDDSEFNIFNTDRQLAALETAAKMLGQLSEIDAAIRSGVSFWPIDARGLVAQAPLGDATKGSPGNMGMYSGASALAVTASFQQSQDTL